jgi:hypothetical protein
LTEVHQAETQLRVVVPIEEEEEEEEEEDFETLLYYTKYLFF